MRQQPLFPQMQDQTKRRWYGLTGLALACSAASLQAATADSGSCSTHVGCAAGVELDFEIRIDQFIFLRLGSLGNSVNKATFTVTPVAASGTGTTSLTQGNNLPLDWDGQTPSFMVTARGNTVPVQVRSNAGQVMLHASVGTPLSNGSYVIPMSAIHVSSNSLDLPAPLIPASGSGIGVHVPGSAFDNLVTERNASWTFNYVHQPSVPAGSYAGTVSFTASAP